MNDSETTLMIDKIKSQKDSESLIEDITIIINRYNIFSSSSRGDIFHALTCNAYKCITLAISLYIAKYSSPLPTYVYRVKHIMEEKILSEEFLSTNEPTYEWLIDIFQYTVDIPVNTPNSEHTQYNSKQVSVKPNMDYVIFNRLALLIKDKTIPFTINFNSRLGAYYGYLISVITGLPQDVMKELICIQTLKARADSNVTYTLFEEALNERLKKLCSLKAPLSFINTAENLREAIRVLEVLDLKYTKHLTIKGENDNIKDTLQTN